MTTKRIVADEAPSAVELAYDAIGERRYDDAMAHADRLFAQGDRAAAERIADAVYCHKNDC